MIRGSWELQPPKRRMRWTRQRKNKLGLDRGCKRFIAGLEGSSVTPTLKTRTYDYHMGAVPDPLLENSSTATSFAELLPLSRVRRIKLSCEIVLFSLRSNPRKFMNHDLSLTFCCPFPRQENNPGTLCCVLAILKKKFWNNPHMTITGSTGLQFSRLWIPKSSC